MITSKKSFVDGDTNSVSVRRFASFGLLDTTRCNEEMDSEEHSPDVVIIFNNLVKHVRDSDSVCVIRVLICYSCEASKLVMGKCILLIVRSS